ncbi:hypothetical protein VTO73DRAFT_5845 [Trametes versicolor]
MDGYQPRSRSGNREGTPISTGADRTAHSAQPAESLKSVHAICSPSSPLLSQRPRSSARPPRALLSRRPHHHRSSTSAGIKLRQSFTPIVPLILTFDVAYHILTLGV